MTTKILVLGGYGNFGKLISKRLSRNTSIDLYIAGRSSEKAKDFLTTLENKKVNSFVVDVNNEDLFSKKLIELRPHTVINSCGPYTDMSYKIARLCLKHESNYIDLADSMEFVEGIDKLQNEAISKNKVVISGASTVPGLSSIVVDHFKDKFDEIESIDAIISPGNKQTFRGVATVASVFSYCGEPYQSLKDGKQQTIYGWQGMEKVIIPGIMNNRLVGNCKVPDVALFPKNYRSLKNFDFKAGTELKFLQIGIYLLSILKRMKLIGNISDHAVLLDHMSRWFSNLGTDEGGMNINIHGTKDNKKREINWSIVGIKSDGPEIPSTPAVVLVEKLIKNEIKPNAYPCWELFSLKEFMKSLEDFNIYTIDHEDIKSVSDPVLFSLGQNNFNKLPDDIRKFHSLEGGKCAGNLKVTRGNGILSNIIASIVGFPKANESTPVTVENKNGNWSRDFDGLKLNSKWLTKPYNGIVIEDFGFSKFGFQLVPLKDNSGFRHITKKLFLFGIPIPNFFNFVNADGITKGLKSGGWEILVEVRIPIVGLLVKYEGKLQLTE
eukprot:gene434-6847_t